MTPKEKKAEELEKYRAELGQDPPVPPEEYAWQWEYRGTKEEREALLGRLADDDDEPREQIHQEESLF